MANNGQDKYNTRHHFVQKAYLDKFAEKAKISIISRTEGTTRTQETKSVANVKGLYTFINDKGEKDGSLEDALANEIEGPAITVINNMTSVFPYIPHGAERSIVAYYIALQYLRTPEAKRRFELQVGTFTSIEMFNLSNDDEKVREYLQKTGKKSDAKEVKKYQNELRDALDKYEIIPDTNAWIPLIKQGMDDIAPLLVNRYNWHMYYHDKPTFITSDHPVVLRRIHNDARGIGFANADEIIFPLSKKHALLLSTDNTIGEGVYIEPAPKASQIMNDLIMRGCYMEFYAPPSLAPFFSGQPMKKRPIIDRVGGDDLGIDFLRRYSGVLERERPSR